MKKNVCILLPEITLCVKHLPTMLLWAIIICLELLQHLQRWHLICWYWDTNMSFKFLFFSTCTVQEFSQICKICRKKGYWSRFPVSRVQVTTYLPKNVMSRGFQNLTVPSKHWPQDFGYHTPIEVFQVAPKHYETSTISVAQNHKIWILWVDNPLQLNLKCTFPLNFWGCCTKKLNEKFMQHPEEMCGWAVIRLSRNVTSMYG